MASGVGVDVPDCVGSKAKVGVGAAFGVDGGVGEVVGASPAADIGVGDGVGKGVTICAGVDVRMVVASV